VTLRTRLKDWIGRLVFSTGAHRLLLGDRAVIAVFHRVDDRYPQRRANLPLRKFREFCLFFRRHFTVVPYSTLVERLERGESVRGLLAITFDDGYRDNLIAAVPVLQEFQLPACFFITAGWVGTQHVPLWDREWNSPGEWLSWDDIRAMRRQGFEIGAHTVNHVDLGTADPDTVTSEIRQGKEILERALGEPVEHFAYPFGAPDKLSPHGRRIASEIFRSCASAHGGLVSRGNDPFRIPRNNVARLSSPYDWALDAIRSEPGPAAAAVRASTQTQRTA